MGYYSKYTLRIARYNGSIDFKDVDLYTEKEFGICLDRQTDDRKWYSYDEDMIHLSKKFPNVLFQLDGEGEESGDIWRSLYCNGETESSTATFTYPGLKPDSFFSDHALADRVISNEEYKDAVDAIERANAAMAKANDLIVRYQTQNKE